MSTLAFGKYEQRLAEQNAQVFQKHRENFQPFMACHGTMRLLSVVYKPTVKGQARWIGQVDAINAPRTLPITLWQEDVDFLNSVLGTGITQEPLTFQEPPVVITSHCDPKWGLNRVDSVVNGGIISKTDVNWRAKAIVLVEDNPIPTPIADAIPEVKLLPAPKPEPQFSKDTIVHLYNPSRQRFMQSPYTIEAIKGEWYGLRDRHGLLWRKAKDLEVA